MASKKTKVKSSVDPIILVPLDLDEKNGLKREQFAVSAAAMMSAKFQLCVECFHAEDMQFFLSEDPSFRDFAEKHLDAVADRFEKHVAVMFENHPKVHSHGVISEGVPSHEIVKRMESKREPVAFAVVATQAKEGLKRILLGSCTEEVLRNASRPVLVLGKQVQAKYDLSRLGKVKRILVATDLGPNSKKAEDFALHVAGNYAAKVTFFHHLNIGYHPVLQTAQASPMAASVIQDWLKQQEIESKKGIELRQKHFSKKHVKSDSMLDRVTLTTDSAILKAIDKVKPDLVITGTHGRNFLSRAFLGSSVRGIIEKSPVPTFIVHSQIG